MSVFGAFLAIGAIILGGIAIVTALRIFGWIFKWIFIGGIIIVALIALFLPFAIVGAVIAIIVVSIVGIVRAVRNKRQNGEDNEDTGYVSEAEMQAELVEFYGDDYDYGTYDGDPNGTPGITDSYDNGSDRRSLSDF